MVYNVFSWREKLEKETTFSTRTDLRGKTEVLDFLNKKLNYNPDVHCEHHHHSHENCGENKGGCVGNC